MATITQPAVAPDDFHKAGIPGPRKEAPAFSASAQARYRKTWIEENLPFRWRGRPSEMLRSQGSEKRWQ
jgi:hypothetical protein